MEGPDRRGSYSHQLSPLTSPRNTYPHSYQDHFTMAKKAKSKDVEPAASSSARELLACPGSPSTVLINARVALQFLRQ